MMQYTVSIYCSIGVSMVSIYITGVVSIVYNVPLFEYADQLEEYLATYYSNTLYFT